MNLLKRRWTRKKQKKTKKGSLATSANILEHLPSAGHKFPEFVLKWRQLSKNKEPFLYDKKLNDIQSRINESIIRCEEFLEKEKEFKKKYFKDENINFDNIIV